MYIAIVVVVMVEVHVDGGVCEGWGGWIVRVLVVHGGCILDVDALFAFGCMYVCAGVGVCVAVCDVYVCML